MAHRIRVYNPGRDTRFGTLHSPNVSQPVYETGTMQRHLALVQTRAGQPATWFRWKTPLEQMDAGSRAMALGLFHRYREFNLLIEEDGQVYWYLRWARAVSQMDAVPAEVAAQLEALIAEMDRAVLATEVV